MKTGLMVEVYKNRTSTAFLKPVIWILSDFGNKKIQMVAIRGRF